LLHDVEHNAQRNDTDDNPWCDIGGKNNGDDEQSDEPNQYS